MGWLPWKYGVLLGIICVLFSLFLSKHKNPHVQLIRSFLNEASILAFLYALWVFAGKFSVLRIDSAIARGEWLWQLERQLSMPSEKWLQEQLIAHSILTQSVNIYYFAVHVPAMGVFLVWLFLRYRNDFATWRNTLAGLTGSCLAIQLLPVAPPRLVPSLGVIDTGVEYGQSVYEALSYSAAGQYQAMPSIHVGWAALIGWAVWKQSESHWRWLAVGHAFITFYIVAATGNHYWLDGIAAIALMIMIHPAATWLATFTDENKKALVTRFSFIPKNL